MSEVTPWLKEAQTHLKAGDKRAALKVLKQAHQHAPRDYRVWLLLAQAAPDAQKRADCIRRAEQLASQATAVQKAVAWLEKQQKPAPVPAPQPDDTLAALRQRVREPASTPPTPSPAQKVEPKRAPRPWGQWLGAAIALLVLVLFIAGGGWWVINHPVSLLGMTDPEPSALLAAQQPAIVTPTPTPSATETAVPTNTTTPTPSPTPLFDLPERLSKPLVTATAVNLVMANGDTAVRPKQISTSDPRPTWTPTPVPTNTPTPTPTPQPTFVAESGPIIPPLVAPGEKWIDVNLTTQTLRAYEGDKLVLASVISSGRAPYYTVTGQFRIYLRYPTQTMDGRSLGFDYVTPNVPHVQYFYGNFALHGAFWHNDFGTPVSHGCVNLNLTDAAWLYEWADYGTLVNVHY